MFLKNGFDEERLFTPQGSYALMQCLQTCSSDTWPTKPVIDRILPCIDPETQEVTDPDVIPRCPKCGGPVFMNVRGGGWFLEDPYVDQAERFEKWIALKHGHLLLLEIGSGFNTPGVIRWPMERITCARPGSHLVRVNPKWPQVPDEISGRSLSLQCSAMDAVTAVWTTLTGPSERLPRACGQTAGA